MNLSFNCNVLPNFVSVMVEAFANEVTSERFCEALRFAFIEVQVFTKYNIITEMPTSGDLKSGDSLFHYNPWKFNKPPPPSPPLTKMGINKDII